jgi:hypothetical protein
MSGWSSGILAIEPDHVRRRHRHRPVPADIATGNSGGVIGLVACATVAAVITRERSASPDLERPANLLPP